MVNLRLSHASLVCHPHWRPELESALDDMYATERDYRLGCEAADAIEAACGADSVKWKRALAVGLDALTLASSPRLKPGDSLHSPDSKGTSGLWERG